MKDTLRDKLADMEELRPEQAEQLDQAILVGYHVTCEWVDPAGDRWLSTHANKNSTSWQRLGYIAENFVREIGEDAVYRMSMILSEEDEEDEQHNEE